jgi:hypothetical protein
LFEENNDSPKVELPFSEDMQLGFLGHLLQNEKVFSYCRPTIEPGWFINLYAAKAYKAKRDFYDEFKRVPSLSELKGYKLIQLEENSIKNKILAIINLSLLKTSDYQWDYLEPQLTIWMNGRTFHTGIQESVKLYNSKKPQEAFSVVSRMAKTIEKTTFQADQEMDFSDFVNILSKRETERRGALTFGSSVLDRLLLPPLPCERCAGTGQADTGVCIACAGLGTVGTGSLLKGDMTVLMSPSNIGKCHGIDTPIMLANGAIRKVQDIVIGDELMGPDGKPRKVLSTTKGFGPLFKIKPNAGGEDFVCNDAHVLSLKVSENSYNYKKGDVHNIPLNEYQKKSKNYKKLHKLWRAQLDFKKQDLPLDPYILGLWLGDGSSDRASFTSMDKTLSDAWSNWVISNGDEVAVYSKEDNRASIYSAVANKNVDKKGKSRGDYCVKSNLLLAQLGLKNNKHIPHKYLTSSRNQRLELLAGIIDTDGHSGLSHYNYDKTSSSYEISTVSKQLSKDYNHLIRSLGFKSRTAYKKKKIKGTGFEGWYYVTTFNGLLSQIPVRLERKKAKDNKKNPSTTNFKVESIGNGSYYGFTLDGDHLYLLGDFTVTHNTTAMITVAMHNVRALKDVLFISHEGAPADLYEKFWCSLMGVDKNALYKMYRTPEGRNKMEAFLPLYQDHFCYLPLNKPGLTVEEVEGIIARKQDQHASKNGGKGFDLIVCDYPAKTTTSQGKHGHFALRNIQEWVYNYWTQMALYFECHSLVAIQTNREGSKVNAGIDGKEKRLLRMEDVSETWGAMTTATNVITANRDADAEEGDRITYNLCKSRSSKKNIAVLCRSKFGCAIAHSDHLGAISYRGDEQLTDSPDRRVDDLLKNWESHTVLSFDQVREFTSMAA